jgi:hypothetical protein
MYELLDSISTDSIATLKTLLGEVPLNGDDIRVGAGGVENMSVLQSGKWLDWTREQRATFKSALPEDQVSKAVVGSFLHIPATTGFLDAQDYWVNAKMCGTMYAYALETGQKIIINGKSVTVKKGQGIKFSLKEVHEIKGTSADQNWACLMLMI